MKIEAFKEELIIQQEDKAIKDKKIVQLKEQLYVEQFEVIKKVQELDECMDELLKE